MTKDIYRERLDKVLAKMKKMGLDIIFVADPKSIWYLTGMYNDPYERMYVLSIEADGREKIFANKLFNLKADVKTDIVLYSDSDDPVKVIIDNSRLEGVVGIDKIWPAKFLLPLLDSAGKAKFTLASSCLDECRACKDEREIQLMKESSAINDAVIEKALTYVKEGMTEKEVASFIDREFVNMGADGPCFETIVSFGANAADPHHSPDDTRVKDGDCVLIDMGCIKNHYCSDMTRTAFFRSVSAEMEKVYLLVKKAQEYAESVVKPGVALCDVDKAARSIIEDGGYGKYFTHRLGHFCGQTDHETGDVSSSNRDLCRAGMIFSIEPGIYLPGIGGVRIEDLVLVTDTGCLSLNKVDKDLKLLN